jgi:hypothetical protein
MADGEVMEEREEVEGEEESQTEYDKGGDADCGV